jgi:hypothetical protein
MPQNRANKKKNGKSSRLPGGRVEAVDRAIAQSATVVGRGMVQTPRQDFGRNPPSWLLTQHPPPQIRNQLVWVQGKFQETFGISNSVPTEHNRAFTVGDITNLVGLTNYFDQYCIYSVTVNVTPDFEGAGSTLYTFGSVITAIDYDNVSNVGSINGIEAYASAVTTELLTGQSVQRYLKPCIAPALFTSSAAFSGYGVQRLWVDSSSNSIPHYGFRSYFVSNTVAGLSMTLDYNYVIGLRNNF